MIAGRLRADRCLGCGGPMSGEGRIDRRYCRPGCRTLAYRMRLRTRGLSHGPTAVPRWAVGRLPELAVTLTTLGRVQGNVTVLARQLECEEASVRAQLLRLREQGAPFEDVEPPEPEARLRAEIEALRRVLGEALAQRNAKDDELKEQQARSDAEISKLRKELEDVRQSSEKQSARLGEIETENATLKAADALAARKAVERQTQAQGQAQALLDEQSAHRGTKDQLSRTRSDLTTAQERIKALTDRLSTVEKQATQDRRGGGQLAMDLSGTRRAEPTTALQRPTLFPSTPVMARVQHGDISEAPDGVTRALMTTSFELQSLLDQRANYVTDLFCRTLCQKAEAQGNRVPVGSWIEQHFAFIELAGRVLTRYALIELLNQVKRARMKRAAEAAYSHACTFAVGHQELLPTGFSDWMTRNKQFLLTLSRVALTRLATRPGKSARSPQSQQRRAPQTTPDQERTREETAGKIVSTLELEVPSMKAPSPPPARHDSLAELMKDKVQLLHMLAERQEERRIRVTGRFVDPFTPAKIAEAAREEAMEARREYYFRPQGVLARLVFWEQENLLLDAASEKTLFGEVMEQIDKLKVLVDKLKP